jgi:hypothetical protein
VDNALDRPLAEAAKLLFRRKKSARAGAFLQSLKAYLAEAACEAVASTAGADADALAEAEASVTGALASEAAAVDAAGAATTACDASVAADAAGAVATGAGAAASSCLLHADRDVARANRVQAIRFLFKVTPVEKNGYVCQLVTANISRKLARGARF